MQFLSNSHSIYIKTIRDSTNNLFKTLYPNIYDKEIKVFSLNSYAYKFGKYYSKMCKDKRCLKGV